MEGTEGMEGEEELAEGEKEPVPHEPHARLGGRYRLLIDRRRVEETRGELRRPPKEKRSAASAAYVRERREREGKRRARAIMKWCWGERDGIAGVGLAGGVWSRKQTGWVPLPLTSTRL